MSGSRRSKWGTAAALALGALVMAALLTAGPGPGAAGAGRGPWAVTREVLARLWNGALQTIGLRSETSEDADPATGGDGDAEPTGGDRPAEPKRGGATDPDG